MKSVKKYFENNLTSYNYLFFAAAGAIAYKAYYKYTITSETFLDSKSAFEAWWRLLSPTLFIVPFLAGSLFTFKPSSDKWDNFFLWSFHILLSLFIIFTTPLG